MPPHLKIIRTRPSVSDSHGGWKAILAFALSYLVLVRVSHSTVLKRKPNKVPSGEKRPSSRSQRVLSVLFLVLFFFFGF